MSKALDAAAIAIAWGEPCEPFAAGPLCRWEHRTQAYRNACIAKARAAIAAFLAAETEWVLVPVAPDHNMTKAAIENRSVCDEGEHIPLGDYIDAAENHTRIVVSSAVKAAISAAPEYPLGETP